MEELLQKLLEAEVLSEETKKELEQAFEKQLTEAVEEAKQQAAADVRAELTEQWINERDALIEAVDSKVGEFLEQEIEELKEDIERFRDLEAEYAEKLVEAKAAMADELKDDLLELVETIDTFLEIRLNAEFEELREDLEEVRKNEFGRKIFEAFAEEFMAEYADEESAEATLRETQERLADVEAALEEAEQKRAELERKIKMEEVLSPLSGRQREVMEAILRNVDTEHLEEGYKTFIGRVIRETEEADSEKENKVLAEGASDGNGENQTLEEKASSGVKVTGDTEEVIEEGNDPEAARRQQLEYLKKIAGIK